ncbi:phosphonoacetate hydrolase [Streptomyces sp. NBC_01210]|uniref:phosphonoacetate hydrolase n=1 Tax=Streptomyces sp. NBC_01210 TaxID=2903774 RepID=UPI002E12ED85|nr:phosphonoacetate hydrolase [Streptomyces sp. NBC_01210]
MSSKQKNGVRYDRVEVNSRTYPWPTSPVVVICVDGSEPAYHERAIADGRMPFLEQMLERGSDLRADCVMPSFTNPNNLSIATGVPPAVHGICGNYFYDADADAEVMMNDPELLRAPTLFSEFSARGASVTVITAKDKLRRLLGRGLKGICFSAEKSDQLTVEDHGIDKVLERVGMDLPSVYSAELSELVLAAGVDVLERDRPELMYLSLTDYIQHKHAPGSKTANDFYAMMDGYLAQLDALGAVVVVTADHGMNAKSAADGSPQVIFLQTVLDGLTAGPLGTSTSRVVLPITDPYTVHHGALGSYATLHLPKGTDVDGVAAELRTLDGIEEVIGREDACRRFELPADRIGELVVIAERNTALGTSPDRHDVSGFTEPLRSHGGLTEQRVPFLVNRKITELPAGHRLRNFDAYWVATALASGQQPPN